MDHREISLMRVLSETFYSAFPIINSECGREDFSEKVTSELDKQLTELLGYPPSVLIIPVLIQGAIPSEASLVDLKIRPKGSINERIERRP